MAYDSITKRGNPANAELHKEFLDDSIGKQESGQEAHHNYDDWYESNKKVTPTPEMKPSKR